MNNQINDQILNTIQNNDQFITNNTIPTRTTWKEMDCLLSQANITMPTMTTSMHNTLLNEFSETMEPFSNSFDHQISMIGIQFDANSIISGKSIFITISFSSQTCKPIRFCDLEIVLS